MENKKQNQWAIVELFGHTKIAGKLSEQVIGGCSFIRIDVPEINGKQAFTKLFGQGAIYSISFVDEETAIGAVQYIRESPIDEWSARKMIESTGRWVISESDIDIKHRIQEPDGDEITY